MNKIMILSFLLISSSIWGQKKEEAFIKKVAEETCTCMSAKGFSDDMDELQMSLGLCVIEVLQDKKEKFEKFGYSFSDEAGMVKFGEKIGFEMAINCHEFRDKMMRLALEEEEPSDRRTNVAPPKVPPPPPPPAPYDLEEVEATITDFNQGQFFSLTADVEGEAMEIFWLYKFDGDVLLSSAKEELKGQKVRIAYRPLKIYNPKTQNYEVTAVLWKLEKLD